MADFLGRCGDGPGKRRSPPREAYRWHLACRRAAMPLLVRQHLGLVSINPLLATSCASNLKDQEWRRKTPRRRYALGTTAVTPLMCSRWALHSCPIRRVVSVAEWRSTAPSTSHCRIRPGTPERCFADCGDESRKRQISAARASRTPGFHLRGAGKAEVVKKTFIRILRTCWQVRPDQ